MAPLPPKTVSKNSQSSSLKLPKKRENSFRRMNQLRASKAVAVSNATSEFGSDSDYYSEDPAKQQDKVSPYLSKSEFEKFMGEVFLMNKKLTVELGTFRES